MCLATVIYSTETDKFFIPDFFPVIPLGRTENVRRER